MAGDDWDPDLDDDEDVEVFATITPMRHSGWQLLAAFAGFLMGVAHAFEGFMDSVACMSTQRNLYELERRSRRDFAEQVADDLFGLEEVEPDADADADWVERDDGGDADCG